MSHFACTCRFTKKDEFSHADLVAETECGYHAKMREGSGVDPVIVTRMMNLGEELAKLGPIKIVDAAATTEALQRMVDLAVIYERALETIRDECFSGNAYDIAVSALAKGVKAMEDI